MITTPGGYTLCTVNRTGQSEAHPEPSWPRVLEDMAQGFSDFPMIVEVWLYEHANVDAMGKVLLWRRI